MSNKGVVALARPRVSANPFTPIRPIKGLRYERRCAACLNLSVRLSGEYGKESAPHRRPRARRSFVIARRDCFAVRAGIVCERLDPRERVPISVGAG